MALCRRSSTRNNVGAPRRSEAATKLMKSLPVLCLYWEQITAVTVPVPVWPGAGPVAWVGFDNGHLAAVATDDWARLGDRTCGNNGDVVRDTIWRVAAVTRVA